ncbi:MAG: RNA polymerase sigma-70 factor (ECF subfamily) [Planctomycetota bacterium]|jgi:RNA polymerase sigma-70 factor (ECF subfamily)
MNTRTTNHLECEFAEHSPFLRALARRLASDYAAAEDLVQETYVAALSNKPLSTSNGTKGLLPWFATVLRNRAALRRRTDHRRKARDQMVAPAAAGLDPASVASRIEVGRRLLAHVEALGPDYRAAIFLRYYEGLEPREIAAKLGLSVGTIKTRLARAMAQLREQLEADDPEGRQKWLPALCALGQFDPASTDIPVAVPAVRRAFGLSQWFATAGAVAAVVALVWILWPDSWQPQPTRSPQAALPVGERKAGDDVGSVASGARQRVAVGSIEPVIVVGVVEDAGIGADVGTGVPAANVTVRSRLSVPGDPAPTETGTGAQALRSPRSREVEVVSVTDAQGRFQIELPPGANLRRAVAVGNAQVADAVWSVWTNTTRPESLVLTRYLRTVFAGEVIEPSGMAVAGARVALTHWEKDKRVAIERFTDDSGRFEFSSVPDDSWLMVEHDGYVQVWASNPTAGPRGGWRLARVVVAPVATLELAIDNAEGRSASSVQGVGVGLAGAEAGLMAIVPDAGFTFRARAKVTNGRATLAVPAGLQLELHAGDSSRYLRERDGLLFATDSDAGQPIVLAAGERRALRLVNATDVAMRVTVFDPDGQPVPAGIELNFAKVSGGGLHAIGVAETDARGQLVYCIATHERGVWVVASASGAGATAGTSAVRQLRVEGVAPLDVELHLAERQDLVGSVRDRDGQPIDAHIRRILTMPGIDGGVKQSGWWQTDEGGAFRVPSVPGAKHRLEIESGDFATEVLVGLEAGGAAIDVVLERPWSTRLQLRASDPSVKWLRVRVDYLDPESVANRSWPVLTGKPSWSRAVRSARDERLLRARGSDSRSVHHSLAAVAGAAELGLDSGPAMLTISGLGHQGKPRSSLMTGPVRIPAGELVLSFDLAVPVACRGRILFADDTEHFVASVALADDQGRLLSITWPGRGHRSQSTLPAGTFGHFAIGAVPAGTWELRVGTRQQLERGEAHTRQRVVLAHDRDEPIIVRL